MCGRYTLTAIQEALAEEFDLIETEPLPPRFNIAPTQMVPVVRALGEQQGRQLDLLRWGLIPHWAKDPSIGNRMINARSEEADKKPSFRTPMRKRRCLVPCTGFYEWKQPDRGTGRRPNKQPYLIRRRDQRVFAFAGLWEHWQAPDAASIDSYTILTTAPNELVRPLHNRMPVIVSPDDYELWLDPEIQDVDRLKPLFGRCSADEFVAYAVGTRVNSPSHDDPSCIEAIA